MALIICTSMYLQDRYLYILKYKYIFNIISIFIFLNRLQYKYKFTYSLMLQHIATEISSTKFKIYHILKILVWLKFWITVYIDNERILNNQVRKDNLVYL